MQRRNVVLTGLTLGLGTAVSAYAAEEKKVESSSTERPVRRKDYLLTEEEAWYVIQNTPNAVMGTTDASGIPYAVPVTPLLLNGKLYIHGTKDPQSRKYENLRQNPHVSLVWIGTDPVKEDEFTVKYVSAMVAGTARLVEDRAEMQKIFEAYTQRFAPSQSKDKQLETIRGSINDVALWEVTVQKISGKAKAKSPFFDKMSKN